MTKQTTIVVTGSLRVNTVHHEFKIQETVPLRLANLVSKLTNFFNQIYNSLRKLLHVFHGEIISIFFGSKKVLYLELCYRCIG